jgi:hypothetical protein
MSLFVFLAGFLGWVSDGFGGSSGGCTDSAFLLLSRFCTRWPVAPLLSGLLFASLFSPL